MSDLAPRTPCPDAESLAAYVDGRPGADRMATERHLAECVDCRDLIGAAVDIGSDTGAVRPGQPRRRTRWYAAGAALVTAAAAIVVAVRFPQSNSELYVPEMAELVTAVGSSRPVEPRLTGGFAYGPPPSPTRGEGEKPSLSVLSAAARIEERARAGNAGARAALGVAQVLLRVPDAARTLEDACSERPEDGRCRSDLAAAYLVMGRERNDGEALARALDAAERAVKLTPSSREAWFNRALASEYLGLTERARTAWEDYLRIDAASEWAAEARRRRDVLASGSRLDLDRYRIDLAEAARRGDTSTLRRLVSDRPREARDFLETALLTQWAAQWSAGERNAADTILESADRIAVLLNERTADRLLLDSVRQARRSEGNLRSRLATAFRQYASGRQASDAYQFVKAHGLLTDAATALRDAANPLAVAAEFHGSLAAYHRGEYASVRQTLDRLEAEAETHGAAIVRGFVLWRRGLVSLVQAQYADALRDYRRALPLFERAGERDHVASVENAIAEALRFLGDIDQSWAYQLRALRHIGEGSSPARRHAILLTAGLTALRNDLPAAALAFQDELLHNAEDWGEPAALTSAHLQRARSLSQLARGVDAEKAIELARAGRARIADPIFAEQYENELLLAEGETLAPWQPARAVTALDAADARFAGRGTLLRRAHLLLARGRAKLLLDHPTGARDDFSAGIETFERRRSEVPEDDLRISYFDQAWDLFDEMIRMLVARGDPLAALAYVERARSRDLLSSAGAAASAPLTPSEIQRRLPPRTQVLYYAVLEERTFGWLLARDAVQTFQSDAGRQQLRRLVNRLHTRVRGPAGAAAEVLTELHRLLVEPAMRHLPPGDTLAVVADDPLFGVPFAALIDRTTGDPLVARHPILLTGSGTLLVRPPARRATAPRVVLAVGNPRIDATEYPDLADLPDAAAEAERIAQLYGNGTVLSGERATKAAVLALMERSDIVHFAGHAVANPEFPWLSKLVLAPSADGSALFAHEIARRRMEDTRLVVLGACSSATGVFSRGEGPLSLARPFLLAGVPTVIGTLWSVPDRASRRLLETLHEHVRAGIPPVLALREAQLALIGAPEPELNAVAAWGGFVTMGPPPERTDLPRQSGGRSRRAITH